MMDNQPSNSAELALRERVKELTCLYAIAQLAAEPGLSIDEILEAIVKLIPPAWQYPEITSARILLDGGIYATPSFKETLYKQKTDIIVNNILRGFVEVVYGEKKPDLDEGPFLKEERHLINAIAKKTAFIIERREIEEDKAELQEQLRHADRLATIGQLAMGVAHELNEPLGNILGFAQLVKKAPGIPESVIQDIGKIETASLHAREIIKKLLVFARQLPPVKTIVDLNKVIIDGLFFLEARCAKAGIDLQCMLSPELPKIIADPAQLNQVLVNLVVNALQAMPEGGKLKVSTSAQDEQVSLLVEDNGIGMEEEILKQIFMPFFTTKDVGEGTGLGLPVAHGIITAHGGTITVESTPKQGTRFEIRLPQLKNPE
ncbi:MAG: ATP-binding protein [Planctomycetes bacterium]|nr:ATP-binding protein [Planctomycetota bacterium]